MKQKRNKKKSSLVPSHGLTVLSVKVGEAQLRALGGDEDLSIEGEDHGLVLHVDHAAHHVPGVPAAAKQAAAHVQTVTLHAPQQEELSQTLALAW